MLRPVWRLFMTNTIRNARTVPLTLKIENRDRDTLITPCPGDVSHEIAAKEIDLNFCRARNSRVRYFWNTFKLSRISLVGHDIIFQMLQYYAKSPTIWLSQFRDTVNKERILKTSKAFEGFFCWARKVCLSKKLNRKILDFTFLCFHGWNLETFFSQMVLALSAQHVQLKSGLQIIAQSGDVGEM